MILIFPKKYTCNNNDLFKVTNADVDFIKPTQPYERPKPLSSRQNYFNNVEAGLPLEKDVKHSFKAFDSTISNIVDNMSALNMRAFSMEL